MGGGGATGGTGGGDTASCPGAIGQVVKLATIRYIGAVGVGSYYVFYADEANVYNSDGEVLKVPKSGGTPETLASGISGPMDLIVADNVPYWTNIGLNVGGEPSNGSLSSTSGPIDTTKGAELTLTSNGQYVVYSADWDGVRKVSLGGGIVSQVSDTGWFEGIAADASTVYLEGGSGTLQTVPVTGGSPSPLVDPGCVPQGDDTETVLVDDTNVYWLDVCGSIWKMPKTGGTPKQIAKNTTVTHAGMGHRIAMDATRLYWIDPGGSIMSADKATGAVKVVVNASPLGQGGIAVDDTGIYWGTSGAVWCTPKP